MKKLRILPFLLVLPLLSGCEEEINEPKFVSAKNKVEYASFVENLENAIKENSLLKSEEGYYRPSYESTFSMLGSEDANTKRDDDTVGQSTAFTKNTLKVRGDSKNLVSRRVQESENSIETSDKTTKSSLTSQSKSNYYGQAYSQDGAEYFAEVQLEGKYYVIDKDYDKATEEVTIQDHYESEFLLTTAVMKALLISFKAKYETATDEAKSKFNFFEKNSIFTAELETKDTIDTVDSLTSKNEKIKFQLDLSNKNSVKFTHYNVTEQTSTIKVSKQDDIEGDIKHSVEKSLSTLKATKKNVHLKAQKLDKFVKYEY